MYFPVISFQSVINKSLRSFILFLGKGVSQGPSFGTDFFGVWCRSGVIWQWVHHVHWQLSWCHGVCSPERRKNKAFPRSTLHMHPSQPEIHPTKQLSLCLCPHQSHIELMKGKGGSSSFPKSELCNSNNKTGCVFHAASCARVKHTKMWIFKWWHSR